MTDQLKHAINAAKTAQTNDQQAEATRIASSSAGDQTFDMNESSYKTSHTAIRKARRFAMQGLYEWLVTDRRFDIDGKLGWKANAPMISQPVRARPMRCIPYTLAIITKWCVIFQSKSKI